MNELIIKANLSFDLNEKINKKFFEDGIIVDFSIRKDMLNSGKINFTNKKMVLPGESQIEAIITFAYGDLVLPFIKEGSNFTFGEPSTPYGKGIVITILNQ